MQANRKSRRGGFTLLEVLLVLAILSVIAAIVVPNLLGRQKKALVDTARRSIDGIESTLQLYAQDHEGEYPSGGQEEMIAALMQPKNADGTPQKAYLDKRPSDPWGEVYNYRYPATKQTTADKPDIWSNGPDKQNADGGDDDVNNWTE